MVLIRNFICDPKGKVYYLSTALLCFFFVQNTFAQSFQPSEVDHTDSVKIGFLITRDPSDNVLIREAVDVVNLVVGQVNEAGGIQGKPIDLAIRSTDGNWGTGSKEAVNLITEHGATALLGFVDGRSAHLIEQVCAKARIPFLSIFSADPSLSKINIPWFFSTMPHADQQAKLLASTLATDYSEGDIVVISSDDYDQDLIRRSFIKEMGKHHSTKMNERTFRSETLPFEQLPTDILTPAAKAIVFFGNSGELKNFHSRMSDRYKRLPVYTSIYNINHDDFQNIENPVFTIAVGKTEKQKIEEFQSSFISKFGYIPSSFGPVIFDSMQTLLTVIESNGSDPLQIQESLRDVKYEGINGVISFDSSGMTEQPLILYEVSRD